MSEASTVRRPRGTPLPYTSEPGELRFRWPWAGSTDPATYWIPVATIHQTQGKGREQLLWRCAAQKHAQRKGWRLQCRAKGQGWEVVFSIPAASVDTVLDQPPELP